MRSRAEYLDGSNTGLLVIGLYIRRKRRPPHHSQRSIVRRSRPIGINVMNHWAERTAAVIILSLVVSPPVGEELVSSRNPGPLAAGGDELLPYRQVGSPERDNSPVVQY